MEQVNIGEAELGHERDVLKIYMLVRHVNLGVAKAGQMQVGAAQLVVEPVQARNIQHRRAVYMLVRHVNLEVANGGRMQAGIARLVAELVHA